MSAQVIQFPTTAAHLRGISRDQVARRARMAAKARGLAHLAAEAEAAALAALDAGARPDRAIDAARLLVERCLTQSPTPPGAA